MREQWTTERKPPLMTVRPFARTDTYNFANPHKGIVEFTVSSVDLSPVQFDELTDLGSKQFRVRLRPAIMQLTPKGAYDCDRMPSAASRTLILLTGTYAKPKPIGTITMSVTLQAIVDEDELGNLIEMTLGYILGAFDGFGHVLFVTRPPKPAPAKQLATV
jgi:hypothetical protein